MGVEAEQLVDEGRQGNLDTCFAHCLPRLVRQVGTVNEVEIGAEQPDVGEVEDSLGALVPGHRIDGHPDAQTPCDLDSLSGQVVDV